MPSDYHLTEREAVTHHSVQTQTEGCRDVRISSSPLKDYTVKFVDRPELPRHCLERDVM